MFVLKQKTLVALGLSGTAALLAPTQALAVGEPVGDYPSYQERVILYLTNRARSQPEKFNPAEPYPATPPVRWDLKLSEAARFHAKHIVDADCWCEDHSSCCQLEQASGGGAQCGGASSGCGGTDASTRVLMFSPNYSAENMAKGQRSGAEAVDGWIHSSGHWKNMNGGHSMLGVGEHSFAWVQDFGRGGSLPPVAEDGIHVAEGGAFRFGINYYQASTGGPQSILAIVDGQCHELALESGKAEHGAFETSMSLEPGCHRYYFYVRDGKGEDHVYPSTGSYGVAVGDAQDCPFFTENRPADTCSPAGQPCETGDTRACYTGPYGTRDIGICESGTERCIGGQWTGECRLQVMPEAAETCDDDKDNDCDGVVDNGCAKAQPDMGQGSDMGTGADQGSAQQPSANADDGGCAQSPGSKPAFPAGLGLLAALGYFITRHRRRR